MVELETTVAQLERRLLEVERKLADFIPQPPILEIFN